MVEELMMSVFSQVTIVFPEYKEGNIADFMVGAWKGIAQSEAIDAFGYEMEIWWMDGAKDCFEDPYGTVYQTWASTFEALQDSDSTTETLYKPGLYMGSALYLNRVSIDNDCLATNYPDSGPSMDALGGFFKDALEDPDVLGIAINTIYDESDGAPQS